MPTQATKPYVGRFAPSPTGPLHFGSLLAAVASYLEARRHGGRWLVRIEDMDPPREQQGADIAILRTLEAYGFEWSGDVIYQSRTDSEHREAVQRLLALGLAYRCGCSRRELADAPEGTLGTIYPGTCRNGCNADEYAIRVLTDDRAIVVEDRIQGRFEQRLESESGDFIILRRDGLVAYQLAVVIDDALQGITDVVRGIDLLDSTPRQMYLQQLLGLETPGYAHIPVAEHPDGSKLSKATGAEPVSTDAVPATLVNALAALGQAPPKALSDGSIRDVWTWAQQNWRLDPMRGRRSIASQHYC